MTTKLTLSIEKSVIEKAKVYARKSGKSLSDLVETYFATITEKSNTDNLPADLKKLFGAVDLSSNFDEKKELRKILSKKHKL